MQAMGRWIVILGLTAALLAIGQTRSETGLKPEVLILARVKAKMAETLRRQPNYTCMETIQRSLRRAPARRYRMLDTLRLEVAIVEGKEMFSWPGAREFRTSDPREMVPSGTIGTGYFAMHARAVFISNVARFTYVGQEEIGGRLCERFDFKVPLMWSGYRLRVEDRSAIVAYSGSFWADAKSYDVVRLDIHAEQIPPSLGLKAAHTTLEYSRLQIGGHDFLLPQRAVTTLTQLNGDEDRNETLFSDCRQYTGESFISFAPPPEDLPDKPAPPETVELPAGLRFEVALETGIEDTTPVGTVLEARVTRDVKRKNRVLLPKGARVTGRLLHLERIGGGLGYFVVALGLENVEFDQKEAELTARLVRFTSYVGGGQRPLVAAGAAQRMGNWKLVRPPQLEALPGAGVFYVKGGKLHIPAGSRMVWEITAGGDDGDAR